MILTTKIEQLQKDQPNLRITAFILRELLSAHPALDYADELLSLAKRLYGGCPDPRLCEEAKALFENIEGKV